MTKRNISTMQKKAVKALNKAVYQVVEEHKCKREPLAVWQKGKVALIKPTQKLINKFK